jgi:hypothetical protein
MSYQEDRYRQTLRERAERSRAFGKVRELEVPLLPEGAPTLDLRENARFKDDTYESLIGFGTIAAMTTGSGA